MKKANFAEMFNKKKSAESKNNKRVYGQFLLQFDLKEILGNIRQLREIQDLSEREKYLAKNTSQTHMYRKSKRSSQKIEENPF